MIVYLTGNKGYILYVLYRLHVRENQRDNELWIVHRHMQYYEQDTERRPTKQKLHRTENGEQDGPTIKLGVKLCARNGQEFLFLIRHRSC